MADGLTKLMTLADLLTSSGNEERQINAIVDCLHEMNAEDAAWVVYFLSGKKLKRLVYPRVLADWFMEIRQIPTWLFEESEMIVKSINETIALFNDTWKGLRINSSEKESIIGIQPNAQCENSDKLTCTLAEWINQHLKNWELLGSENRKALYGNWLRTLSLDQLFLVNQLLTGTFSIKISQPLLVRALSRLSGQKSAVIQHRLLGEWLPCGNFYTHLISSHTTVLENYRRHPFMQSQIFSPADSKLEELEAWWLEWEFPGIRSHVGHHLGRVLVWSSQEELLNDHFPELQRAFQRLPDGTTLEGHIVALSPSGDVLPLSTLQTRLGGKKVTSKVLESSPIVFIATDILEHIGEDIRHLPLHQRKRHLLDVVMTVGDPVLLSHRLEVNCWETVEALLQEARQKSAEHLVLKRINSTYGLDESQAGWWHWKPEPYTLKAVLLYAQATQEQTIDAEFDYTFGVQTSDGLVPIGKTNAGLEAAEQEQLNQWIRNNTTERFGPVRSVEPFHVFELAFDGIQESKRRKAGVMLLNPRIVQWEQGAPLELVDTLDKLRQLFRSSTLQLELHQ